MNRPSPLVRLFERRTRALRRQLSAAIAGKDVGVHQARVASRRLREAVPVLTEGLQHSKSGKAQRKIRRLTQALGTVRELDVTLHLIDELGERPGVPRAALAEVRALVIEDRERRRAVMLERLESVDTDKLARRLEAVRQALLHPTPGAQLARGARAAHRHAGAPPRQGDRGRRADLRARGAAPGPDRREEAALRARDRGRERRGAVRRRRCKVIKRVQDALGRLHDLQILQHHVAAVGAAPRGRRSTPDAGLAVLSRLIEDECRHLHGRYVAQLPALREAVEAARRDIPLRLTPRRKRSAADGRCKMSLAAKRRAAGGQR